MKKQQAHIHFLIYHELKKEMAHLQDTHPKSVTKDIVRLLVVAVVDLCHGQTFQRSFPR